ncbi:uncharacterized protein LOC122570975 isoform X2 [Bombus pyrosoma]|uniref:uncharacterized protein LOC122570975 isoform X2 n=1 Tax=Bombus pyrosoma TaxID=396416 RepID=UPI001CB92625|nr:uncharacterized protein LOC122570975 isoform X2 [Bombus pyrosoma]
MYVGQCWGQETLMRHLRVSAKTKGIVSSVRKKNMHARYIHIKTLANFSREINPRQWINISAFMWWFHKNKILSGLTMETSFNAFTGSSSLSFWRTAHTDARKVCSSYRNI